MTLRDYLNRNIRRSTIWCWMMLPFAAVVVITQARGYVGFAALVICLGFYVIGLY